MYYGIWICTELSGGVSAGGGGIGAGFRIKGIPAEYRVQLSTVVVIVWALV